eukprot:g3223.t1
MPDDVQARIDEATTLALYHEDIKGASSVLRTLVREKQLTPTHQRQIVAAWAAGNRATLDGKTGAVAVVAAASSRTNAIADSVGWSGGRSCASSGCDTTNEGPVSCAEETTALAVASRRNGTEIGRQEDATGAEDADPEARAKAQRKMDRDKAKELRHKFEDELLMDKNELSKEQRQRRREEKEKVISEIMRKQGKSRKEAVEFITQGGLDAEKMQAEMGAPTDQYWEDLLEKGPPEWFNEAFANYEAKKEAGIDPDAPEQVGGLAALEAGPADAQLEQLD